MSDTIYLDAAASAPIAPEALAATVAMLHHVGNPGASHRLGSEALDSVEVSRERVAALLSVGVGHVIFVASATEANNLALRGLDFDPSRRAVLTTATDHPSVAMTANALASDGRALHLVEVASTGEIDLDSLKHLLLLRPGLVSIHAANNETGVIQPLTAIVEMAHEVGALVHTDASQLMAWGPQSILDDVDLVTVSSHKMYGPQGAAALVVNPSSRQLLTPQVTGGGQERGLRSGTPNVAAIAGFGAAAELALASGDRAELSVSALRDALLDGLTANLADVIEHGGGAQRRLPGILNVAIGAANPDSAESDALLARTPALAASTGSACHAGTPEPSPVLRAMGISEWEASRSIRFSLSRYTTNFEVRRAVQEVTRAYTELSRVLKPSKSEERRVR